MTQSWRHSQVPRQVGENTIHGLPSWWRCLQDGSHKIDNRQTPLYIYKFNDRKKRSNIYTVYQICLQHFGVSWFYCKRRKRFTIDWDVFVLTVNTVLGGSVVHNRIKTTTISDSNQAQVQHLQCSTHLHDTQTNTFLKPTQESMFFSFQATDMHWALDPLQTFALQPSPAGRQPHNKAVWKFPLLYAAHLNVHITKL